MCTAFHFTTQHGNGKGIMGRNYRSSLRLRQTSNMASDCIVNTDKMLSYRRETALQRAL